MLLETADVKYKPPVTAVVPKNLFNILSGESLGLTLETDTNSYTVPMIMESSPTAAKQIIAMLMFLSVIEDRTPWSLMNPFADTKLDSTTRTFSKLLLIFERLKFV